MKRVELLGAKDLDGEPYVALVSEQDWPVLSRFRWYAFVDKYTVYARAYRNRSEAKRLGVHREILMHNLIMGFPCTKVDHKDLDGLNNTRENLRSATEHQNNQNRRRMRSNSLGIKGVCPSKNGKFRATIWLNGKSKHLGTFADPTSAHEAYRQAAAKAFGDFARYD